MGRVLAALALPVFAVGASPESIHEIIIRHDRDDAAHVELGHRYESGLVQLNLEAPGGPPDGHGTLVAPPWVLTAAHVAREVEDGHELTVGGENHRVDAVTLHPDWSGGAGTDIALIRLAGPVDGVVPVALFPGDSGNPAFADADGEVYVVGVGSSQSTSATGGREGLYGVTEYYVRVSSYVGWIESTMGAE